MELILLQKRVCAPIAESKKNPAVAGFLIHAITSSGSNNAHVLATLIAFLFKLHDAFRRREQGVVAALANVVPSMEPRSALPHQDVSGTDGLTAIPLHTEKLGV